LGEFSPNGLLFTLGSYLKITEVAHIFWLLYSMVKFKRKVGPKIVWATFWAIFSQTHLVTLLLISALSELRHLAEHLVMYIGSYIYM
jgi:hypothetical protein